MYKFIGVLPPLIGRPTRVLKGKKYKDRKILTIGN